MKIAKEKSKKTSTLVRIGIIALILVSVFLFLRTPAQCDCLVNVAESRSKNTGVVIAKEELYRQRIAEKNEWLGKLQRKEVEEFESWNSNARSNPDELICSKYAWHDGLPFLWFLYKPMWSCPNEERIGEIFDGGKWVCDIRNLRRNCIMYSYGSDQKVDFEFAVSKIAGCEIHIFDPTIAAPSSLPPKTTYHSIGLAEFNGDLPGVGPVQTLATTMQQLGHSKIDILKIDIQGAEWKVFEHLDKVGFPDVKEILIELHYGGFDIGSRFFEILEKNHYRIFHHEPNLFFRELPAAGIEYSFIKVQDNQ